MNCAKCRFFEAVKSMDLSRSAPSGSCRRYPPDSSRYPVGPNQFITLAGFPEVRRDDWCGEFMAKLAIAEAP